MLGGAMTESQGWRIGGEGMGAVGSGEGSRKENGKEIMKRKGR